MLGLFGVVAVVSCSVTRLLWLWFLVLVSVV